MQSVDRPTFSPGRWPVLHACSEACAAFRRLRPNGWSDYGWCTNPVSPRRGTPVRIGRDCPYALAVFDRPDA